MRGQKFGNKEKQGSLNSSNVSVKDLEKILGVNVTELQEVIKKYKSEESSTTGDCPGENDVTDSSLASSGIVGDNLVGVTKPQDGCKKDEIRKTSSETVDNKGKYHTTCVKVIAYIVSTILLQSRTKYRRPWDTPIFFLYRVLHV